MCRGDFRKCSAEVRAEEEQPAAEEAAAAGDASDDLFACLLSGEAQAELDAAARMLPAEDGAGKAARRNSKKSTSKPEAASSSRSKAPVTNESDEEQADTDAAGASAAFYQKQLGVLSVGTTLRRGVVCLHCHLQIPVGSARLVYAYARGKPPRSIHPTCVMQIPGNLVAPSIKVLQKEICSGKIAAEKAACDAAVEVLSGMQ